MDLIQKIKILHNNLAVKNYKKVIEGSSKILRTNPDNAYVLNLTGMAYQGLMQHKIAIKCFHDALAKEPKNIAAMNNLANSYKAIGKLEFAEKLYKQLLVLNPNYLNALNNFANLKFLINKYSEGIEFLKKAILIIEKNPEKNSKQLTQILFTLASAYQSIGDIEETKKVINKILLTDSNHTSSHKLMSEMTSYRLDDKVSMDHLNKMVSLNAGELTNEKKVDISFALGKAYEDLEDYNKSFDYLRQGNQIKNNASSFDINSEIKLFNGIKNFFKDYEFNNSHKNFFKKKIIYICGMPRSGTTLVEQIISTHNEVYGAGELIFLQESIKNNLMENFKLKKNKFSEMLTSPQNKINDDYFDMFSIYNISEKTITDKAPQNFRWIGFMKVFFPNCKVIHCYRNSKDNCLSIFKNNFASSSMNWTYDEKNISTYFNLYSDLMKFWKSNIPSFIHDVEYEKLVNNKEGEIKKILNFCELDWDERCLNPHKNSKTPIKTVSINQARKPIYKSSLNSNSRYDKYLKKMFDALN